MPGKGVEEIKRVELVWEKIDWFKQQIKEWLEALWTDKISALVFGLGLISLVWGIWQYIVLYRKVGIDIVDGNRIIMVDVGGAVVKPGVYQLKEGQRVIDAVMAAGGFDERVDLYWVDANLNKARFLVDGEKIYIPFKVQGGGGYERVSLNYGSFKQLDALPGVGRLTVEKIIKNRPFADTKELLEKGIVSKRVWEMIKNRISL